MGARGWWIGLAPMTLAVFFAPSALAQKPPRDVIVHLNATPDVTLERQDGDDWTEVCFAPCDMPFSTRTHYRVGGGIRDSAPFRLRETQPGLAIVAVEPRSRGMHALGDVFIGLGSAMTFFGSLAALFGASISSNCSEGTRDSCGGSLLLAPGISVAVLGVGMIVLGVDLAVVNTESHAHSERATEARDVDRFRTMSFDLSRRKEDAWTRPTQSAGITVFSCRF